MFTGGAATEGTVEESLLLCWNDYRLQSTIQVGKISFVLQTLSRQCPQWLCTPLASSPPPPMTRTCQSWTCSRPALLQLSPRKLQRLAWSTLIPDSQSTCPGLAYRICPALPASSSWQGGQSLVGSCSGSNVAPGPISVRLARGWRWLLL